MQEFQPFTPVRASAADSAGVSFFASQVVSLLADRGARALIEPRETLVEAIIVASLSGSKAAFAKLLTEVKRARISVGWVNHG
jgi:hypothetical protein